MKWYSIEEYSPKDKAKCLCVVESPYGRYQQIYTFYKKHSAWEGEKIYYKTFWLHDSEYGDVPLLSSDIYWWMPLPEIPPEKYDNSEYEV